MKRESLKAVSPDGIQNNIRQRNIVEYIHYRFFYDDFQTQKEILVWKRKDAWAAGSGKTCCLK